MYAIVRNVPSSFASCVTSLDKKYDPFNIGLAKKQHEDYVGIIREPVEQMIEIPPDEGHSRCCFVEDIAVVVEDEAIVNFLGSESRRKEVSGVEKGVPVIKDTVHMHEIDPEATLDGEDVLYTGKHLLIGLSHCTKPTWCRCPKQRVFRKVPRLHYTESLGP
ncbi:hypothetical protein BD408DRAFT_444891 [Parasitella parasitica]|nr:hypothetical protein BD408DRAFT_444891 [Parasitella parasitica]